MLETTQDADPILVQAGWRLYSRDGADLGEVLGADQRRIIIAGDDLDDRWQLSTGLLQSQEEGEMRASLEINAENVERAAKKYRM